MFLKHGQPKDGNRHTCPCSSSPDFLLARGAAQGLARPTLSPWGQWRWVRETDRRLPNPQQEED